MWQVKIVKIQSGLFLLNSVIEKIAVLIRALSILVIWFSKDF